MARANFNHRQFEQAAPMDALLMLFTDRLHACAPPSSGRRRCR